jgi:phosphoserine phosphatase RsbU/P
MAPALSRPPAIRRPIETARKFPCPPSLPLGITVDAEYTETTLRLVPGDTFTFFSDGVIEAQSPTGELFGFERSRAIASQSAQSIADIAQRFGQEDDITVLTLKFAPA